MNGPRDPPPDSSPRSRDAVDVSRGGLPRPLSNIVGREKELADIERRLASGTVRLLTLTGPGGVGKTRIAFEVGRRLEHRYRDGARLVPLSLIHDPNLVAHAIARAVGLRRDGPIGIEAIIAALHDVELLLIIDNFEHVIESALIVSDLLVACPHLTVLVTSRSILHLSGEHVYPIPPMPFASPDASQKQILATDAARLFIDRAEARGRDLPRTPDTISMIAAICERLEGMPLAIELAASQVATLSLEEILERLEERLPVLSHGPQDHPERLQTMRAAIAWGYDLLGRQERHLLRRLAIFEAGFGLEIVEALLRVDDATLSAGHDPLAILERLVSQSFVRHIVTPAGFSRYVILDVVREFLLGQVATSGETESAASVRLEACLALARESERHLISRVDPSWLDRLELEHLTISSALRWGFNAPTPYDRTLAVQLAGHLWLFWYYHGHLAAGRHWLELATEVAAAVTPADRARIHLGLGTILHYQGDMERAGSELARAQQLARDASDNYLLAYVRAALGNRAEDLGHYAVAEEHFAAAEHLFRQADDPVNVAVTIYHRGITAFGAHEPELAASRLSQALELSRQTDDPWSTGATLAWLGLLACRSGELSSSAASLAEAIDIFQRIGSFERMAEAVRRVAVLAAVMGRPGDAVRLFAAATAISKRLGSPPKPPESDIYDETLADLRRRFPGVRFTRHWDAGAALAPPEAIGLARAILGVETSAATSPAETPPALPVPLSERELDVLRLLAEGETDATVARTLSISRRTVASHVSHIYNKIGVSSRAAAAAWAVRNGVA